MAVENDGDPQVAGDRARRAVQDGLDLLEVAEQPRALVEQVPAVPGEDDPATDPLEQRDPGLPLEALDLLGDGARGEAQRVGRGHDRAVGVDGAAASARAARSIMKRCYRVMCTIDSLVLHGRRRPRWGREPT